MANELTVFSALGNNLRQQKDLVPTVTPPPGWVSPRRGGWVTVFESFTGAWQRNIETRADLVMANWAVFACITLIASDIGKLRLKLYAKLGGIWQETQSSAFSPVLRKPNRYQTRQKFIEQWIVSKLSTGNAYVLKERDNRGVVVALYVLDPNCVRPLVAPDGSVYYSLKADDLAGIKEDVYVPASEIIHDTAVCLFHPLVGISPIYACGLAATQGLRIQENSARFFANQSRPGGIITAPDEITDETANRIKRTWSEGYGGENSGKVAVLGDGLKYEATMVNAVDSQMVEQLQMSAKMVCSTFHVPPFKIGIDALPAGQKVGDMNQIYYTDCLQSNMEAIEALLDEGLGLDTPKDGVLMGTGFELDDLLKMDGATLTDVLSKQVGAALRSPDEGRAVLDLPPVPGGATPYLQQQNYSLAALDKRDTGDDPFGAKPKPAPALPAPAAGDQSAKDLAFALIAKFTEARAQA